MSHAGFKKTPFALALAFGSALPLIAKAEEPAAPAQLPAMTVTGQAVSGDYNPGISSIGGKVPMATRDIPQTVNVVTRAVLDSQNATTLTDALRNVPGITLTAGEGGQIGNNINLRGFTARTDLYLDGQRDRGQYTRDTFALDSVEVLKGPSSLFFGRGSTGGVINQVSKTPLATDLTQVSGSVGSDDYYRSTADLNRVLSDHAAVRVAAMVQDVHSTRDVVENKDWGLAPSLRVNLSPTTDLLLSGLMQHNRDIPDYGIPFLVPASGNPAPGTAPAPVGFKRFYGDTDDYFDQNVNNGRIQLDHRFSPDWRVRNQLQVSETTLRARPTPYRVCTNANNNAGTAPQGPCPVAAPGVGLDQITVQSDRRDREIRDRTIDNQLDVIGQLHSFGWTHALVGGLELGRDETRNQTYTWSPRETHNLANFEPGPTPANATRTQAATRTVGTGSTIALYLNDTISFTPQWKAVLGLRRDRFSATAQTLSNSTGQVTLQTSGPQAGQPNAFERTDYATSLRSGVIWQPDAVQSYYASYGTSFNPSAEAITISAAQSTVAPEKSRSMEVGGKWDLFSGNLSLNSALFRIQKSDARTTDPVTAQVTLDGDTQVQGIELGAVGRLTPAWQLVAGYTWLDSELKKSKDVTGGVAVQGNQLANTPRNSGSLWSTYRLLQNWELGGGVYYVGHRYVTNANTAAVDGYWRADALAAYHQPRYDVQINVQNLFDTGYYDAVVASEGGRAVSGRGRTAICTGTWRF